MSSIDKDVERVAQNCDSSARMVRRGDQLVVKIDGETVVTLNDRYGYINEYERAAIERGIRNYRIEQRRREDERRRREDERRRREEEERRRREEEERRRKEEERRRLEAERKRAIAALEKAKSDAAQLVDASVKAAESAAKKMHEKMNALNLADGGGHDVTKFNASVREASKKIDEELTRARSQAQKLKSEIAGYGATQTEQALAAAEKLKRLNKSVQCNLSACGYDDLERERAELERALAELADAERKLVNLASGNGAAAARVADIVKMAREVKIACSADARKLAEEVAKRLEPLKSELYADATSALRDEIDALCGSLADGSVWRGDYSVQYERSHIAEIEVRERAERAIDAYKRLLEADYTVCGREEALDAIEYAARAIAENSSDSAVGAELDRLIETAANHAQQDRNIEHLYRDYCAKRDELVRRGVPVEQLPGFDARDYEKQRGVLIDMLVESDVEELAKQTEMSFMAACKIMIDRGFKIFACDLSDGAAYEAIFVKEERDGAAWQIVAEGDRVTRRLVGIQRTNGEVSSVDSRMAAAVEDENSGDDIEFVRRLSELSDEIDLPKAVSSGDDNARQAIESNGVFVLESKEAEREYDRLVGGDAASQSAAPRASIFRRSERQESVCSNATSDARAQRRSALAKRYQNR